MEDVEKPKNPDNNNRHRSTEVYTLVFEQPLRHCAPVKFDIKYEDHLRFLTLYNNI